jgi:serine/threonine protein kinase
MAVQEERSPGRLGPYRLRERLGEGGMGVVYLATDPDDRLVAVKALRRGVPGELTARRRLAREFETMRRVHSPFVAEVIDADVDSDPPYIVTRYVPGRTIEEVVAQDGPLAGLALLRLACGLARALTAVHAAGVVHRDLKPANVMIVDGEPVVIDFGIAQAPDSTRLTMTGMFMGTPGYLAPEVIEGSPSGPAADVHSWAATLAFAATGRPPFGSGSFESVFYRIINGQPDLANMPGPLMPLVLHALARDPARRPAAIDLANRAAALDPAGLLPGQAPTIPPAGWGPGATRGDLSARQLPGGWRGCGHGRHGGGRRGPGDAGRRPASARPAWLVRRDQAAAVRRAGQFR